MKCFFGRALWLSLCVISILAGDAIAQQKPKKPIMPPNPDGQPSRIAPRTIDDDLREKHWKEMEERAKAYVAARPGSRRPPVTGMRTRLLEVAVIAPGDDELRRLLKDRYNAIGDELCAKLANFETGRDTFTTVYEATCRLVQAGLELCEGPIERCDLLSKFLEFVRQNEARAVDRYLAGSGGMAELNQATAQRIDAEIQLLRAKRQAGLSK
jgi:hypothetical protein